MAKVFKLEEKFSVELSHNKNKMKDGNLVWVETKQLKHILTIELSLRSIIVALSLIEKIFEDANLPGM